MKDIILTLIFVVLGILCLGYGVIVKSVASGTGFYAVWIAMGMISFAVSFACLFGVFDKMPKSVLIGGGILLLIGAVLFIGVEALIASGFDENGDKDLDYIIVLGAQIHADGNPSSVLKYRLDKAKEYLDENPNTVCIVSGGKGSNEPITEADGMANYLINKGVDESRIIKEDKSMNTSENIEYTMQKVDLSGKTVGVVTNNFHIFRATHIAKKQGITNVQGISANATKLYIPNNMFREFFGMVKFLIK